MRGELEPLHHPVLVLHVLRQRHVEHRPRRLVEREAGELRVAHDADDAKGADVLRQVEAEVLLERIFVALEKPFYECVIDHGYRRGRLVVGRGERAAADHRHAEIRQIVGAHPIP